MENTEVTQTFSVRTGREFVIFHKLTWKKSGGALFCLTVRFSAYLRNNLIGLRLSF